MLRLSHVIPFRDHVFDSLDESGLTPIGLPMEVVRLTEARYAEQAEYHLAKYLSETLAANQMARGRYNAAGEFGALYAASDAETAWEEFAHRLRRQGIKSVPPSTTLLILVLTEGLYADVSSPAGCELWQTPFESLVAVDPTPEQQIDCHKLGQASLGSVRSGLIARRSPESGGDGMPRWLPRQDIFAWIMALDWHVITTATHAPS